MKKSGSTWCFEILLGGLHGTQYRYDVYFGCIVDKL